MNDRSRIRAATTAPVVLVPLTASAPLGEKDSSPNRFLKIVLCFAPALFLLFVATESLAQALWQGTTYGMSAEEVLQKIPRTERVAAGEHLGNGAMELVRIPTVEVVKTPFEARFYFANNKLTQVTLAIDEQVPYATARPVFDHLLDQFRRQYGRERLDEKQAGPLASSSATWLSDETKINITFMSLPNTPSILNVNYQARPDQ